MSWFFTGFSVAWCFSTAALIFAITSGVIRGDVEGLAGVGFEIEEQRRVVRLGLRRAVGGLRDEVRLPRPEPRGEQLRAAVVAEDFARSVRTGFFS